MQSFSAKKEGEKKESLLPLGLGYRSGVQGKKNP